MAATAPASFKFLNHGPTFAISPECVIVTDLRSWPIQGIPRGFSYYDDLYAADQRTRMRAVPAVSRYIPALYL